MKKFLTIILLFFSLNSFSQSKIEPYELGLKFMEEGKYELAVMNFKKCLEEKCYNKSILWNKLATCASRLGNQELAIEAYRYAIEGNKKDFESYTEKAYCEILLKKFFLAEFDLQEAIKINPNYARTYTVYSILNLESKNYDGAEKNAKIALDLDYKNAEAYFCRGLAREYLKKWDLAIEDFSRAYYFNNKYGEAYMHKAKCLQEQKKYEESLEPINLGLKQYFNYAYLYDLKSNVFESKNQLADAIACVDSALLYDPKYYYYYGHKGFLLLKSREFESAIYYFNKELSIDSSKLEAYSWLGVAYTSSMNYCLASHCFEKAERIIKLDDGQLRAKAKAQLNCSETKVNQQEEKLEDRFGFYCGYGENATPIGLERCKSIQLNAFSSTIEATEVVNKIIDPIGIKPNFVLIPCSGINNCCATTINQIRYIIYDNDFLRKLELRGSNSDWISIGVMAHEIGHHLNGHSFKAKDLIEQRNRELEADEFEGFILAKLGASLDQASLATKSLDYWSCNLENQKTHPCLKNRLIAIEKGWRKGMSQLKLEKVNNKDSNSDKNRTIEQGIPLEKPITYPSNGNYNGTYAPTLMAPNQYYNQNNYGSGIISPTIMSPSSP